MRVRLAYIYGLKDPRDGQIYYVGKSNHPEKRKKEHLENETCNAHRVEWIQDLGQCGLEPELVILEKVERENWQEAEIYWIARGYEEGWPLINVHKGGGGGVCKPNYDFMRSYIRPDLWERFEALSIKQKDQICFETALAMMESYSPFLDQKIKQRQYAMHSLIKDELVFIGQQVATEAVALGGT
ncbi:MAG: hypothetical protein FJZ88_06200 [Chloroflexi bacterium]|nr:hypothetical protein [Chloroflexota bacterium]MBM4467691.1 hypothetical protein [Chloroflexota bacterium]